MSFPALITAVIVAYAAGCLVYVYRYRGATRYVTLKQYLRKSWPIFAPLNCLLYMATRSSARRPIINANYLRNVAVLRENWQTIRDEGLALQSTNAFEAARAPGSVGYYDLGFRTFYKRGWSKFYLKWYGTEHRSAMRLCPKTMALLKRVPEVRGAMFSILPAGSELSLHADPLACSLRYHLGLSTPNSDRCHIVVDGMPCAWRDGQDFVFDETYPHHARNDTDTSRLILLCDVERPMNPLGRLFNRLYSIVASGTLVPNTPEDKRGPVSAAFAALAPLQERAQRLRAQRRWLYNVCKFSLNISLLAVLMLSLWAVLLALDTALLG
jgi:beta-hydroxylase